jgi:hypothetical protein
VDASTTRVNADVANGDNDRMVPTRNSRMADRLPNEKLNIFPDAGHRFLFEYPSEFARDVEAFLAWPGTTELRPGAIPAETTARQLCRSPLAGTGPRGWQGRCV